MTTSVREAADRRVVGWMQKDYVTQNGVGGFRVPFEVWLTRTGGYVPLHTIAHCNWSGPDMADCVTLHGRRGGSPGPAWIDSRYLLTYPQPFL